MNINFNDEDIQYLWKLEYNEIIKAQVDMMSEPLELTKDLVFVYQD